MDIKVVSTDRDLSELCAGILPEIAQDQPWSLSTVSSEDPGAAADLHIWDFRPPVSLPRHISWNYSNVVVVALRQHVAEVQKVFGFEPHIVLKPVTRAALSALIGLTISNHNAVSLSDDRDRLLQFLIEAILKLQE